jgi:ParB family chromosome partitioning protein
MTQICAPEELRMIPLDCIDVLNPRERDGKVFNEIVDNIRSIGLKNRSRSLQE